MKTTNKHGLPAPMVEALRAETYDPGDCDITVSRLIIPPQMVALEARHQDEIEEDVSDRIWSLLGTSVHYMIGLVHDSSRGYHGEKRLYMDVDGCRISGKPDLWTSTGRIYDFKVTSVWNYIYSSSIESWTQQLNSYAALIREAGGDVDRLQVIAILRDWSRTKAQYDHNYPQSQVQTIDLGCWGSYAQKRFLADRVQAHRSALRLADEDLPPCHDDERWYSGNKWAIKRPGAKRATKVFDSEEAARQYAIEKNLPVGEGKGFCSLEFRPGEYRRCENYCAGYQFCHQANPLISLGKGQP